MYRGRDARGERGESASGLDVHLAETQRDGPVVPGEVALGTLDGVDGHIAMR